LVGTCSGWLRDGRRPGAPLPQQSTSDVAPTKLVNRHNVGERNQLVMNASSDSDRKSSANERAPIASTGAHVVAAIRYPALVTLNRPHARHWSFAPWRRWGTKSLDWRRARSGIRRPFARYVAIGLAIAWR